jgi:hypothetical protein
VTTEHSGSTYAIVRRIAERARRLRQRRTCRVRVILFLCIGWLLIQCLHHHCSRQGPPLRHPLFAHLLWIWIRLPGCVRRSLQEQVENQCQRLLLSRPAFVHHQRIRSRSCGCLGRSFKEQAENQRHCLWQGTRCHRHHLDPLLGACRQTK